MKVNNNGNFIEFQIYININNLKFYKNEENYIYYQNLLLNKGLL